MRKPLLILLGSFLLIGLTGCSNDPSICDIIIETAKNKEKIKYLEKWIDENIDNKKIWAVMNSMAIIEPKMDQDPTAFWERFNIDWNYLGLTGHGVSINAMNIRFYRLDQGNDNYLQSYNVKAIGFGVGYRNSIIIKVGDSETMYNAIFTGRDLRQTIKINDRVSVICSSKL